MLVRLGRTFLRHHPRTGVSEIKRFPSKKREMPFVRLRGLRAIHFNRKSEEVIGKQLVDLFDPRLTLLFVDVVDQIAEVLFDRSPPEFHASGQSSIRIREFLAG